MKKGQIIRIKEFGSKEVQVGVIESVRTINHEKIIRIKFKNSILSINESILTNDYSVK